MPALTVPQFVAKKAEGKKLAVVTAYDYTMARLVDQAGRESGGGVDAILVGDTVSVVVQGHPTTLPATLDQMVYHAEMVSRAAEHSLVIADMPFPTYHLGKERAIEAASRLLKETGCQAVKLEGGSDQAETIAALTVAGIPVMGHVGLRPQSVHQMGGYRVQRDSEQLLSDAKAVEDAGAFGVVLECIPSEIAADVTAQLKIPTIGIGAGADCDGQVLVLHDLLGLASDYVPRFVKVYADVGQQVGQAIEQYATDVRSGDFPAAEHGYK